MKAQEEEAKKREETKHKAQSAGDQKDKQKKEAEGATVEGVIDEEEDAPPDLETVDLEELNKNKDLQQKEWLKNVVNDTEKQAAAARTQEARAMMEAGKGLLSENQ